MTQAPYIESANPEASFTATMGLRSRDIHEDRLIGPPGTGKTTFLSKHLAYYAQQIGRAHV